MNGEIEVKVSKLRRKKKIVKIVKITVLVILLILLLAYIIMNIIYNNGNFSITLDKNLYFKKGIVHRNFLLPLLYTVYHYRPDLSRVNLCHLLSFFCNRSFVN